MTLPVVVGRCAAYCAHPAAAWRTLSDAGRACLVGAYVAASYVLTLAALLVS